MVIGRATDLEAHRPGVDNRAQPDRLRASTNNRTDRFHKKGTEMTTLNLNDVFAELNATMEAAEQTREVAVAKAKEARDKKVNAAKEAFAKASAEAAETLAKVSAEVQAKTDAKLREVAEGHFEAGGTLDEFADAYGKSVVTTRNHLRELGVDVPQGKRGAKAKYDEKTQVEIAKAWHAGNSRARLELALERDVTEATMRSWAVKHGVFVPKPRATVDA